MLAEASMIDWSLFRDWGDRTRGETLRQARPAPPHLLGCAASFKPSG